MNRAAGARGFTWPVLIALAALATPRVVLHDLHLVEEGSFTNGLLVFVPPACWVAAVVWRRPARPFATAVTVGAIYGVFLAVIHQLLWDAALPAGIDLPAVVVARTAAVFSSLAVGTLIGVVVGAVAAGLCRLTAADRPHDSSPQQ